MKTGKASSVASNKIVRSEDKVLINQSCNFFVLIYKHVNGKVRLG